MSNLNNDKIFAFTKKLPFSFDSLEEHLEPDVANDWLIIYDSLNAQIKKIHPAALFSASGAKGDIVTAVGHSFTVGNAVMLNGTTLAKAQANSQESAEVIGLVSALIDADTISIQSSGLITGLSGLTADTRYFLSPSSAGAMTSTEPSTSGHVSKPVLYAINSTSGFIISNMRGKVI